jgi:hypothetical protein
VESNTVKSGRNQPYGENSGAHREGIKMNREGKDRAVLRGVKTMNRKRLFVNGKERQESRRENRLDKTQWDRREDGLK